MLANGSIFHRDSIAKNTASRHKKILLLDHPRQLPLHACEFLGLGGLDSPYGTPWTSACRRSDLQRYNTLSEIPSSWATGRAGSSTSRTVSLLNASVYRLHVPAGMMISKLTIFSFIGVSVNRGRVKILGNLGGWMPPSVISFTASRLNSRVRARLGRPMMTTSWGACHTLFEVSYVSGKDQKCFRRMLAPGCFSSTR